MEQKNKKNQFSLLNYYKQKKEKENIFGTSKTEYIFKLQHL